MTDDLIARLRDNIPTIYDCMDAADALEAKDKRIAELEEERQDSLNSYMLKIDETIELRARIAALEAALEERHRQHLKLELRCRELEAEKQSFKDGNKYD